MRCATFQPAHFYSDQCVSIREHTKRSTCVRVILFLPRYSFSSEANVSSPPMVRMRLSPSSNTVSAVNCSSPDITAQPDNVEQEVRLTTMTMWIITADFVADQIQLAQIGQLQRCQCADAVERQVEFSQRRCGAQPGQRRERVAVQLQLLQQRKRRNVNELRDGVVAQTLACDSEMSGPAKWRAKQTAPKRAERATATRLACSTNGS